MAATRTTAGHAPMARPNGWDTTKATPKMSSAAMVRAGPALLHHCQAHHTAPITRIAPPRARLPVVCATPKPTHSARAPTPHTAAGGTRRGETASVPTGHPGVVVGSFCPHRGFITVTGQDPRRGGQRQDPLANRIKNGRKVAEGSTRRAGSTVKESVT